MEKVNSEPGSHRWEVLPLATAALWCPLCPPGLTEVGPFFLPTGSFPLP